jgi:mannosidase alpha-like ER degradation enhancer 1
MLFRDTERLVACTHFTPEEMKWIKDKILLVSRGGNCPFYEKALVAQRAGARGVVFIDNKQEPLFRPSALENKMDMPSAFIALNDGIELSKHTHLQMTVTSLGPVLGNDPHAKITLFYRGVAIENINIINA